MMDNKSNSKPIQDNFTDNKSESDNKSNEIDNHSSTSLIMIDQKAVSEKNTKDDSANIQSNGSNSKTDAVCLYVKKNVNLRDNPSLKSNVNLILIKNRKYIIDKYEYRGEWVYIDLKKSHGYLYNSENLFILKGCAEDE